MRHSPAVFALALFVVLVPACDSDETASDSDATMDTTTTSDGTTSDTASADATGDATADQATSDSQMTSDGQMTSDTEGDATGTDITPEDTSSCVTDTVTLATAGTTSACSFPVPDSFDTDQVNVVMNGRELCRRSTRNCAGQQGWFWINGEVGLCDETCIAFTSGQLVATHGCLTEDCTSNCLKPGEFCGNDGRCCLGAECELGNCRSCTPAGESCSGGSCCEGGTCVDGMCQGGFDTQCTDGAGCTQGDCLNYTCRCPSGHHRCGGECLPNDEQNCGGCGNVCEPDEACILNQCQCDPDSGTPDRCGDACVDTQTDPQHCGFCNRQCLTGNKSCIDGACVCGPGLTECSGTCVDTDTDERNCGACGTSCSTTREVCDSGACVCAPGYTDCSGVCRHLQSDSQNCGTCGNACNGQRVCVGGNCVMP